MGFSFLVPRAVRRDADGVRCDWVETFTPPTSKVASAIFIGRGENGMVATGCVFTIF